MYKVKAIEGYQIHVKDLDVFLTHSKDTLIKDADFEGSADIASLVRGNLITVVSVLDPGEIKNNFTAIIAPKVTDDIDAGYSVSSEWIDTETDKVYRCTDNSKGAAVWKEMTNVVGIKHNFTAIVAPIVTDDIDAGYVVGSQWIDTVTDKAYICTDSAKGAAIWVETSNAQA